MFKSGLNGTGMALCFRAAVGPVAGVSSAGEWAAAAWSAAGRFRMEQQAGTGAGRSSEETRRLMSRTLPRHRSA